MLRAMFEPQARHRIPVCARPAAVGLLLSACVAIAAPDAPEDPMQRLIADRGWSTDAAPARGLNDASLARQVRDGATDMVLTAMNFLGAHYRRGGSSSETGFDCSGFTRHVYGLSLGLELPRRSDEQAKARGLLPVKRDELRPGDLVFFNTMRRRFSHVGIYIGEDKFIHAPRSGAEVRIENMQLAYWTRRYDGARRAEAVATQAPVTMTAQDSAATALHLEQWGSIANTSAR
jgi:cell wall-associated NlpC family hydrolase